jgi:hypothetical protein
MRSHAVHCPIANASGVQKIAAREARVSGQQHAEKETKSNNASRIPHPASRIDHFRSAERELGRYRDDCATAHALAVATLHDVWKGRG